MSQKMDLMEVARIGALFISGDVLEEVMPEERRDYPAKATGSGQFALSDEIDFSEEPFNELKKTLLLIERIPRERKVIGVLWIQRPEARDHVEVMVAGMALPQEGPGIIPEWPQIARAFGGVATRWDRDVGETVYYPIYNSEHDIVGVLEMSDFKRFYFV